MARVRFFAQAKDAAGCAHTDVTAPTVGAVLEEVRARYGARLGEVIGTSAIWLNGESASPDDPVGEADELAVLPPVSGG